MKDKDNRDHEQDKEAAPTQFEIDATIAEGEARGTDAAETQMFDSTASLTSPTFLQNA